MYARLRRLEQARTQSPLFNAGPLAENEAGKREPLRTEAFRVDVRRDSVVVIRRRDGLLEFDLANRRLPGVERERWGWLEGWQKHGPWVDR